MATMLYHNGPAVSVLVAARNEETNIGACLAALLDQEFLPERFEIWVGDDDSQDHTAFIVNEMRKSDPRIHLLPISEKRTGMPGKANVLAQLAHYAKGDLILITDADVRVGTGWIRTMVECFTPDIDMISGVVTLYGRSLFAQLQNADWLFFAAECTKKSDAGQPVTALGCNMGIRAEVYRSVGGYENIPFSVTEDYELFRVVTEAGYGFRSVLQKEILATSYPVRSFADLLRQRRRWLTGSFRKNWRFILSFNLNGLYFPALILLGIVVSWPAAGILFLFKWLKDLFFLRKVYDKLELPYTILIALYPLYTVVCHFIFLFIQFDPIPVRWKGRTYQ